MNEQAVIEMFSRRGALLTGHFLLSSGLHSEKYLQCALVLQYPQDAEQLGAALADYFREDKIDLVVAPALGGVIVAHVVARALSVPALFTEREGNQMQLRRGFQISPGARVLVVEDVITTGRSTREVISVVEQYGGEIAGIGSLIDRSSGQTQLTQLPYKRAALANLLVPNYQAESCPFCQQGLPVVKPGSRKST